MKNNIEKLKTLQASLWSFAIKLNNLHWNASGFEFFEIHEQTEKLYEEISTLVDDCAEKIVMHDTPAIGSLKEVLELSKIAEISSKWYKYEEVSKIIVDDLTTIIELTKEVEGTHTIQPMLDEIFMIADKFRWQFKKIAE